MTKEELAERMLRIQSDPRLSARQRAAEMAQLGVGLSNRSRSNLFRIQSEIVTFAGPGSLRSSASF